MDKNNISGNYYIADREIAIVEELLRANNVKYKSVSKHKNANDGDVLVTLPDNSTILIEVKEEDYVTRFSKYGDIGIDLVSAFQFKPGVNPEDWKGIKRGSTVREFFSKIDRDSPTYKGGKITYSKSDLWLFFSADPDGQVMYYSFFPGEFMKSKEFKRYLIDNCKFAVNNKPAEQLSHLDNHNSAVFYINHRDRYLQKHSFDISKLSQKNPTGLGEGGFGLE